MQGSCLCGGVRFEIERATGPFELCHCNRCRKVSGSAFVAGLGVRKKDYRLLSGAELIRDFELPLVEYPPPYRASFCSRCGSSVPNPRDDEDFFEVPAGLLDTTGDVLPDKHIFVEIKSDWFEITDDLPQLDKKALIRLRLGSGSPDEE